MKNDAILLYVGDDRNDKPTYQLISNEHEKNIFVKDRSEGIDVDPVFYTNEQLYRSGNNILKLAPDIDASIFGLQDDLVVSGKIWFETNGLVLPRNAQIYNNIYLGLQQIHGENFDMIDMKNVYDATQRALARDVNEMKTSRVMNHIFEAMKTGKCNLDGLSNISGWNLLQDVVQSSYYNLSKESRTSHATKDKTTIGRKNIRTLTQEARKEKVKRNIGTDKNIGKSAKIQNKVVK